MIERLAIAAGIAAVLGLARFAFAAYGDYRLRSEAGALDAALLTDLGIGARPAIVYFWTDTCGQCKVMQAPALDRLTQAVPDVQVVSVNAVEKKALAAEFGIMTVPTTAVIGEGGRLQALNHGYADEETLEAQLAG